MVSAGDSVPEVRVWLGPREQVSLAEVVADGPVLLLFFLFAWSST